MASKGSQKALSVEQEEFIALKYGGERSPSSGAAVTDSGDVKTAEDLFECKYHGSPEKPLKRTPTIVQQMEKVRDEAQETGRWPVLALRWYLPDSPLANRHGWVDLTVRLTDDDVWRRYE